MDVGRPEKQAKEGNGMPVDPSAARETEWPGLKRAPAKEVGRPASQRHQAFDAAERSDDAEQVAKHLVEEQNWEQVGEDDDSRKEDLYVPDPSPGPAAAEVDSCSCSICILVSLSGCLTSIARFC